MKHVKLRHTGATLAAMAVLGSAAAVMPAGAAAEALPEMGRCVKVITGTGTYEGAKCITLAAGNQGKYNFETLTTEKAAAEKPTFALSGGVATLKTKELQTITCTSTTMTGEYTGPKSSTEKAVFNGCTEEAGGGVSGQSCQSGATSEQIEMPLAEGEIGFIKNQAGKVSVGLDLRPHSPSTALITAVCAPRTTKTETVVVEGSVIAQIKPIDAMTSSVSLTYKALKSGHQVPEQFEGAPTDTLTTTFTGLSGGFSGPSTFAIAGLSGTNSTPLEIKAK
ncbi:MAG: hypothetical protein H0X28_08465 [Solirubrobacterales bacterium]|nr:hypothetical protein [Solirubrobacterales bacterium]